MCFLNEIEIMFSVLLMSYIEKLENVWENPKKL